MKALLFSVFAEGTGGREGWVVDSLGPSQTHVMLFSSSLSSIARRSRSLAA